MSLEDARAKSAADFARLLPDGLATENERFWTAYDAESGAEVVGVSTDGVYAFGGQRPTAVFCANDLTALGMLQQLGLMPPRIGGTSVTPVTATQYTNPWADAAIGPWAALPESAVKYITVGPQIGSRSALKSPKGRRLTRPATKSFAAGSRLASWPALTSCCSWMIVFFPSALGKSARFTFCAAAGVFGLARRRS